jgi:ketosteroid isomerase-like protein
MHSESAVSDEKRPFAWLGKRRISPGPRDTARAMSEENVEAVRELFAAFQGVDVGNFERRLDEVREIVDPEVEWVAAPHSLLASEEYRGYDGVRRFWTQFLSAWDEYGVQVDELIDAGDHVVAVLRLRGRTNELEVDEARSSLITLRDGRIVRIEPFASKDDALEAAGLPE